MAVPKRKHSNSRSGKRRSHHHVKPKNVMYCSRCSQAILPHVVCPNCGHYMGRPVVEKKED